MTQRLLWLLLGASLLLACAGAGARAGDEVERVASLRVAGFVEASGIT